MQLIRLEQIQTELNRMRKKQQVKNSRGPVFTPQIGDIVLFQPKNKHNMKKFVRVTELHKHDLTFTTRDGESIAKPVRLMTPILQTTLQLVSQDQNTEK